MGLEAPRSRLLILFGSQTGNSQDVAERIGREAQRRHLQPSILAMDAYNLQRLPQEEIVVFVAATTGQGEVPSNMKQFWRFLLRKSLAPDSLAGTKYAVFGLGDSGYVDYNVVAKKLDRRLISLGGQPLLPRGLGDDQHPSGYEASLDPWLQRFWQQMHALRPLPHGLTQSGEGTLSKLDAPKYSLTLLPGLPDGPAAGRDDQAEAVAAAHDFGQLEGAAAGIGSQHDTLTDPLSTGCTEFGPGRPCMARVLANQRITAANHFQDTRHIEFDLGLDGPSYRPGDVLTIFPRQDQAAVRALLNRMGLDAEQQIRLELVETASTSGRTSMEVRLGAFIQGVMDIHSASPRRYFFEVLQHFATEELQRERLQHFATAEGREDLALYNQSEGRTVLEVLQDFDSAQLPLEWLIQVCPRLQPRQFSIACSQAAHSGQAHICLAVVDYRTPFKRRKRGLCSTWLAGLKLGSKVPVWVEKGVLHLPDDPSKPLIMIGPGTGVAPFRAFLEEREVQKAAGLHIAASYLFFGSRNKNKDFYYADEWARMVAQGVLAAERGLVTAFSRDQPKKVYVTHQLAENAAQLYKLLQQGAYVYVSGSASKMPQEVGAVFREKVLQAQGVFNPAEAQRYMRQLELSGRYVVEAWS